MWIETARLARRSGHVFYERLNRLLAEHDFDPFVETLCLPFYADCDHVEANGCEANLLTDAANCGFCGGGCDGLACVNGTCRGVVAGTRTIEVEVSELRTGERSVTVNEWIEADTDGDGDLDLVSHSERSGIDHDHDGVPDMVTEIIREDVSVDGHVVHTESQRTE